MAVTREQFDAGMTYDAYKNQMTRNKEQVEQNEKDCEFLGNPSRYIRRCYTAYKDLEQPLLMGRSSRITSQSEKV